MLGEDERTNANEHDESREDDALLVAGEHRTSVGILILAALGHKDGVVVALSKDERGKDDVHHIKVDVQ